MPSSSLLVFPLSPPSSANVSPLITPSTDRLVSPYRNSRSLTSARQRSNHSDSDGYSTETSPPQRKRAMSRAITLPSGSVPFTKAKSTKRTPSVSGSESSASSPEDIPPSSHNHNPAIGRKVAASLDLFRETAEDLPRSEPLSRTEVVSSRRPEPFEAVEHVPEAFEFLKRSEWADRENAAIRRERSAATLDRGNVTDRILERRGSCIEPSPLDVAQWRRDVAIARGRRRERDPSDDGALSAAISTLHDSSVRYVPQSPCGYPPSPSPSRSPTNRQPHHLIPQGHLESHSKSLDIPIPRHSTIHEQKDISTPSISSLEPISPWSTDDESTWETASATATVPSTSSMFGAADDAHDYLGPPHQPLSKQTKDLHRVVPLDDGRSSHLFPLRHDYGTNPVFDLEERLPHIPLRPFRNKVGGHSSIYKFTKQAVCKVRMVVYIRYPHLLIFFFVAVGIKGEHVL